MKHLLVLFLLLFIFASCVRDIGKATELIVDAEASFEQQETSNASGKSGNGAFGDLSALLQGEEQENISRQEKRFSPVAVSSGQSFSQDATALDAVHRAIVVSSLDKVKPGSVTASSDDSKEWSDVIDENEMDHPSFGSTGPSSDRPIFHFIMGYVRREVQARAHRQVLILLQIIKQESGGLAFSAAKSVTKIHEMNEMVECAEFFRKLLEIAVENANELEFARSAKYYFSNNRELQAFYRNLHIPDIDVHAPNFINAAQEHFDQVFDWACKDVAHVDAFIGVHVRWFAVVVTDEGLRNVVVDFGMAIKNSALHDDKHNQDQSPGSPGIWERFLLGDRLPPGTVVQYEQMYNGARGLYKTVQFKLMPAILLSHFPGAPWFVTHMMELCQLPEVTDHVMDMMLRSCDGSAWETLRMEEEGHEDILELQTAYAIAPDSGAGSSKFTARQGLIVAPPREKDRREIVSPAILAMKGAIGTASI